LAARWWDFLLLASLCCERDLAVAATWFISLLKLLVSKAAGFQPCDGESRLTKVRFLSTVRAMPSSRKIPNAVAIAALFVLASCAQQPLSSIDRSKYKTVALDPNIEAPDHYVYRDITGKRSRGIMGGVLGLLMGAASEGPGFHRFDAAAKKNPIEIRAIVRRHMQDALGTSQLLKVVTTNGDTTLKIDIQGYGVGPVNGRELGGIIAARATLTGRDGKVVWKKDEWATSKTTALLENIEANPSLWPKMINEAAEELAKKLVLVTSTTTRTNAEPFM
jgi:hypothetical protein